MSNGGHGSKRIYLTRHAQAEHNVASDWTILDAQLTQLGRSQCEELNRTTNDGIQQRAQFIACSPLRRTMETMLKGYPEALKRLEAEGKQPYLLDILQEAGDLPCDTPLSPVETLKDSQNGLFAHLDFSTLTPEYASKKGLYSHARASDRAREVRKWLRARPEKEIIVVAHGDILRYIMDGKNSSRQWDNTQVRVVTFASDSDSDAEAAVVEVAEVEPEKATSEPTSSEMK